MKMTLDYFTYQVRRRTDNGRYQWDCSCGCTSAVQFALHGLGAGHAAEMNRRIAEDWQRHNEQDHG